MGARGEEPDGGGDGQSPVQPQVRDATECEEGEHRLQPQPRWGDGDHDAQGAKDRGGGERGYTDPWLPKQWMLPQLLQDFHLPEMKDSLMLGLQEEKDKMEITLDTSGYKPDELKVEIKEGELCVEGKHEERSQTGEVMVSRQFSSRFGMPQNVKKESIVSNLSQDGVMVITMPKEQRIEEVERGDTPIQVDHVRSSSERKTMTEEVSAKLKREEILNQGRVDNFEGAGEMQRRRRSLSKAGRSRA